MTKLSTQRVKFPFWEEQREQKSIVRVLDIFVFWNVIREHMVEIVLAVPPERAKPNNDSTVDFSNFKKNRIATVILRMSNPPSEILINANEDDAKNWIGSENPKEEYRERYDQNTNFDWPVGLK